MVSRTLRPAGGLWQQRAAGVHPADSRESERLSDVATRQARLQQGAISSLEALSPAWGDTLYTVLYVLLWWAVAWIAHRQKWFFKV